MLEIPPSNEYIESWRRTNIDASKFDDVGDADASAMARTHAYLELVEEKFPSYEDWDKDNVRPTLADKGCMIVSGAYYICTIGGHRMIEQMIRSVR